MGNAFNNNSKVYEHALTVAEMRLRVLERSMNDQLAGVVRTKETDGIKQVDFDSYNMELMHCMIMTEFAQWAKGLMEAAALRDNPPLIYNPGYDEPVIFGGGP